MSNLTPSPLTGDDRVDHRQRLLRIAHPHRVQPQLLGRIVVAAGEDRIADEHHRLQRDPARVAQLLQAIGLIHPLRSEEHTSELQSLMRISYAVFCLKKKKKQIKAMTSND